MVVLKHGRPSSPWQPLLAQEQMWLELVNGEPLKFVSVCITIAVLGNLTAVHCTVVISGLSEINRMYYN